MNIIIANAVASFSIVMLLFAASLKNRFGLTDQVVLYLPFLMLIASVVVANALNPRHVLDRFKCALAFLVLMCAPLYAYAYGGLQEGSIMERLWINAAIGIFVVLVPWDKKSLHLMYYMLVLFGCLLALNTLSVYEQLGDRSGTDEEIKDGYLSVTFAAGLACLACFYHLVERFGIILCGAFALCWVGIALSLGRGSLLFCALVTILYLLAASIAPIASMSRRKRIGLLALFAGLAPIVVAQVMSVERTASRLRVLFTDTESTSGLEGRFVRYRFAIQQVQDSPIFGNGLGAYLGDGVDLDGYTHNIFLQYAVDGGLIGLLILLGFLAYVILNLIKALKHSSPQWRNTVLASAALLGFMLLSYSKSHDAYRGREVFILSGLAIGTALAVRLYNLDALRSKHGKRRRRRRVIGAQAHQ